MFVNSKSINSLLVTLMLVLAAAWPAKADSIVGDFSASNNPNGNWSYGYTSTLGGSFSLFAASGTGCSGTLDVWTTSSGFPVVVHNSSGTTQTCSGTVSVPTNVLGMHPSSSGEDAVVRWTAAASGTYSIGGFFEGLDFVYPTTTDVHILLNSSTSLFSAGIASFEVPANFALSEALLAGDTIDFVVGYGNDASYIGDTTGLAGNINAASAIPEPSAWLLLGTGILGLLSGQRLRRRLRPTLGNTPGE